MSKLEDITIETTERKNKKQTHTKWSHRNKMKGIKVWKGGQKYLKK